MMNTKLFPLNLIRFHSSFMKYLKTLDYQSFLAGLLGLLGLLFIVYYIGSGQIIEDFKQTFGINYIMHLQKEALDGKHLQRCINFNNNTFSSKDNNR